MIPYIIYKTKGAVEFNPSLPSATDDFPKPGGVFIRMVTASEGGGNKYDWPNSASIRLSAIELSSFIDMLHKGEGKIYHDKNKGKEGEGDNAKILNISKADTATFLNLTAGDSKYTVALTSNEIETISTLFKAILPKLFRWT